MEPDHVYIDIRTCELTLSQVMARIAELQREHPDEEIFMDGDLYAIVGRRRGPMPLMTRMYATRVRA